jgi:NitT/TauT family transport system substrate-binding protein
MRKIYLILLIGLLVLLGACSNNNSPTKNEKEKIVIGYFPNLNHAPAMIAKEKHLYEKHLGKHVDVEYQTFSDGSNFMTALATGEIQGGIVGPGPAMNHYISGFEVTAIAAASTGGTVIMSRKDSGVKTVEDINNITFISPRVGCTHDVQFETYMKEHGITSDRVGGSIKHVTGNPAQYTTMFETGNVDVATAPEPWASVLEAETGANVVIDADEVSFGQTFPAAIFVTSTELVEDSPELVQKLADAHKESVDMINENSEESIDIIIKSISDITGQKLERAVMEKALTRTNFEYDIDPKTIQEFGDASYELQFLKEKPDFSAFVDNSFIQ